MKTILFLVLVLSIDSVVFAQSKIGIVNTQLILERFPPRDSVMKLIQAKEADYIKELTAMDSLLRVKTDKWMNHHGCFDTLRKSYENEICLMQKNIQQREKEADTELLLLKKECDDQRMRVIQIAVNLVASRLGLTTVLDESVVMYFTDDVNITEAVFTEMIKIDESPR